MRPRGMIRAMPRRLALSLDAVIVAVTAEQQRVLTTTQTGKAAIPALPFGPLDTDQDATLEFGLRRWVAKQTGRDLGYVEQLYTFGDRERQRDVGGARHLSVAASTGADAISPGWLTHSTRALDLGLDLRAIEHG